MRVLRLGLANIGPYVDPVRIDFTTLGLDGPFLLEGPTGAGKSTLIDAIVFALYGKVSGRESDEARLVSTFREPGEIPWVELEVETRRGVYRVHRSPAHTRPARRGGGDVTENAQARLWKLDEPGSAGTPVCVRVEEVNRELRDAIGLTCDQFTQTVVLPQGDFASFLHATPEERKGILTRVFGTQVYDDMLAALDESARAHETAAATAESSWRGAAATFASLSWPGGADEDGPAARFAAAVASADREMADRLATARCEAAASHVGAERDAVAEAEAGLASAEATLREAEQGNALAAQWAALQAERTRLSDRTEAMEAERKALVAAERAERARQPIRGWRDARDRMVATQRVLDEAAGRAVAAVDVPPRPGEDAPEEVVGTWLRALTAARLRCEQDRAGIAAWLDRASAYQTSAADLAGDRAAAGAEATAVARAEENLREGDAAIAALMAELAAAEAAAVLLPGARVARDQAQAALDRVRERESLANRCEAAQARMEALAGRLGDAVRAHADAHAAWLGGLAADLASELIDGQPCPVCGSAEHPSPARTVEGHATRSAVDASAAAEAEAAHALGTAREEAAGLQAVWEQTVQAAGGVTRENAEASREAAAGAVEAAERAVARVAAITAEVRAGQARQAEERAGLDVRRAALVHREGGFAAREAALAAERAALDAEERVAGSFEARAMSLRDRAEVLDALVDAGNAGLEARRAAAQREAEVTALLAGLGFADVAAVGAALVPPAELARRTQALTAFDEARAGVEARLAGLAGAGEAFAVDEAPLRACVEACRGVAERCHERLGAAVHQAHAVEAALADLRGRAVALAACEAESRPWARMRRVASGQNDLSMTLPTFVLIRRFDEVLDLANQRLIAMTDGRYELERSDDREGRTRRQGLGLAMIDHDADDARRPTRTLSGGETFLTSLALALGLSDAVTAEAGGIELGTLWVDEGFGSLDGENLDRVMAQLAALRVGGRQVGVISHVEDMVVRITDRLTVHSRGDGTSMLTCTIPGVVEAAPA
ncbi:MAG: SMC family ATPase [Actinomycetia bacterium]|nr:SMC family ATPase [Actinomycetes bacterium]